MATELENAHDEAFRNILTDVIAWGGVNKVDLPDLLLYLSRQAIARRAYRD